MRYLTEPEHLGTSIRFVYDDNRRDLLAVVGTVKDLLSCGFLEFCDFYPSLWCCLANIPSIPNHFGKTRDEAMTLFIDAGY